MRKREQLVGRIFRQHQHGIYIYMPMKTIVHINEGPRMDQP